MSVHHTHERGHSVGQMRALWAAFAITGVVAVVELIGGIRFDSLALGADAAHMVSDTVALGIALSAQYLAGRPASSSHSFGFRRSEVIAAQLNGLLLLVVTAYIVVHAIERLASPSDVQGGGVAVVAFVGLIANLSSVVLLHRVPGRNINLRAASLHAMSDAAGSVGALLAGLGIFLFDATWADSVASIVIATLVVVASLRLLQSTTHVLLEGTPDSIDPLTVTKALEDSCSVLAVHHLHIWSLAQVLLPCRHT